jgi:hypothetical protein
MNYMLGSYLRFEVRKLTQKVRVNRTPEEADAAVDNATESCHSYLLAHTIADRADGENAGVAVAGVAVSQLQDRYNSVSFFPPPTRSSLNIFENLVFLFQICQTVHVFGMDPDVPQPYYGMVMNRASPVAWSSVAAAYSDGKVANRTMRELARGRQKIPPLTRWTNRKLSRRTCTPRYGPF